MPREGMNKADPQIIQRRNHHEKEKTVCDAGADSCAVHAGRVRPEDSRSGTDGSSCACADRGILIGNPGWIERFRDAGISVLGDYGLNIYNSQAKKAYEELGAEIYLISHEAGASDKRGIPLMITEHKVDAASLTDRKGGIHEVRISESGDKTLIY